MGLPLILGVTTRLPTSTVSNAAGCMAMYYGLYHSRPNQLTQEGRNHSTETARERESTAAAAADFAHPATPESGFLKTFGQLSKVRSLVLFRKDLKHIGA